MYNNKIHTIYYSGVYVCDGGDCLGYCVEEQVYVITPFSLSLWQNNEFPNFSSSFHRERSITRTIDVSCQEKKQIVRTRERIWGNRRLYLFSFCWLLLFFITHKKRGCFVNTYTPYYTSTTTDHDDISH